MTTRAILFDVDAGAQVDGATEFLLPAALPPPNANGQIVIPVNAATGALGRVSQQNDVNFRSLVGSGGFFVRATGINSSNAAITRVLVGTRQPDPTLLVAGATNFQTDPIFVGTTTTTAVPGTPFRRPGVYVPAGWSIVFRADDGVTAQFGPIQFLIEVETLSSTEEASRAIGSQNFSSLPVAIAVP